MWQVIDVFSSFGNTVLTVWDAPARRRKTLKLNGSHDFRIGQVVAWENLPDNQVSLRLVVENVPQANEFAILPINRERTILEPIAV